MKQAKKVEEITCIMDEVIKTEVTYQLKTFSSLCHVHIFSTVCTQFTYTTDKNQQKQQTL